MVVRAWPAGHLLKDRIEPFVTTFLNGPGEVNAMQSTHQCASNITRLWKGNQVGKAM